MNWARQGKRERDIGVEVFDVVREPLLRRLLVVNHTSKLHAFTRQPSIFKSYLVCIRPLRDSLFLDTFDHEECVFLTSPALSVFVSQLLRFLSRLPDTDSQT